MPKPTHTSSATRTLVLRHLTAVGAIAFLALAGQWMLLRSLDFEASQRDAARAGERLTSLAAKVRHAGLALLDGRDSAEMARQHDALAVSLDALERSRGAVGHLAQLEPDAEVEALVERAEGHCDDLVATARAILSPDADPAARSELRTRLEQATIAYTGTLDALDGRLAAAADARTVLYRHVSILMVAALLLALLLDTSFAFRPTVRRISRTIGDLESVRRQLRTNLDQLRNSHQLIKADLKAAARIQRSLLPLEPPQIPGVEVAWIFDSCDEVAGDMFNVFRLDEDHVGLYILDVCGHGVQAAMLSVSVTRALTPLPQADGLIKRRLAGSGYVLVPPAEVARELNRRFPVMAQSDQFFTFLYGVMQLSTGKFTYVRAGHPGPLHLAGGRAVVSEGPVGLPIGIEEDEDYTEETLHMAPGDQVLFYTDGVVDLQDSEGHGFGRERLLSALGENSELGVAASLYTLRQRMQAFRAGGRQRDDISALGIGRLHAAESRADQGTRAMLPHVRPHGERHAVL